jgi:hypothetical protein
MTARTLTWPFVLFVLLFGAESNGLRAQTIRTIPLFEIAKNMSAAATDAEEAGVWYRMLFQMSGPKTGQLKHDANATLALMAAWHDLRVDTASNRGDQVRFVTRPLKEADVNYFIGFIEGKINVSVPKWWWKSFLKGYSVHGELIFPYPENDEYRRDSKGLHMPVSTKIERGERRTTIEVGSESFSLDNQAMEPVMKRVQAGGPGEYLSICKGKRYCTLTLLLDFLCSQSTLRLRKQRGRREYGQALGRVPTGGRFTKLRYANTMREYLYSDVTRMRSTSSAVT